MSNAGSTSFGIRTELVNSGVGVDTVRWLLGHRNLQTAQRYAELSGRAGVQLRK